MIRLIPRRPRLAPACMAALLGLALVGCELGYTPPPQLPARAPDAAPAPAAPPETPADPRPDDPVADRPLQGPPLSAVVGEPLVRVRLATAATELVVGSDRAIAVGPDPGYVRNTEARLLSPPLRVVRQGARFVVVDGRGVRGTWEAPAVRLATGPGQNLTLGERAYPGDLTLVAVADGGGADAPDAGGQASGGRRFDVVNRLGMERYLPGVLQRELYPNWEPAAFRAQAIAARSYAVFELALGGQRHFDLESTVASQAYVGVARNPRAVEAVRATHGRVLRYDADAPRVLPAFYSSTCGGVRQDAWAAFRGEPTPQPAPLAGGTNGTWCSPSPQYRWEAIERDRAALSRRLAEWGREHRHPLGGIGLLARVEVSRVGSSGRPASFRVTDDAGRSVGVRAEAFRAGCNTHVPGLPELPRHQRLRSTHMTVTVSGDTVRLGPGRGYGHGVGMCQWGAQGMAQRGYGENAILAHYYPGAAVVDAY